MTDETFRGPTPATPVGIGTLPSRAAGDAPQQPAPVFDAPTASKPKRVRKPAAKKAAPRKSAAKKKPQLSAKEIANLAAKRRRALAAAGKKDKNKTKRSLKTSPSVIKAAQRTVLPTPAPVAPKNPNRPLEMKNQLQAVIAMTGVLTKAELTLFSQIVGALQAVSRNGRKRIIVGLQQVYG